MTSLERLIQHLEHQMHTLQTSDDDQMTSLASDVITSYKYRSNMAVDGENLLPPLLTRQRRAECVTYKHQAVLAEARMRARRKDKLLAQVQEAIDSQEDTSPRSRIFADPSLKQLEQKPSSSSRPVSAPAQPSLSAQNLPSLPASTNKPTVQIPAKPKTAWPIQQTSAQSPTVQHHKLPLELQESSSSSGDNTMGITQSYMFHSSDSSECQTTVIARDEDSDLKQVSRLLREEKRMNEEAAAAEAARLAQQQPTVSRTPGDTFTRVPGIEQERRSETKAPVDRLNASDRIEQRLSSEKMRRASGESAVSDPGVAPRSKGLTKALGLVKDVVGSNERLHRDHEQNDDISSTLSSDYHMYSTASTDIMQYMKVPLSSMSASSTTTVEGRASTAASDRTLTEIHDPNVVHLGGAESGETSTDPPRSRNTSRLGKTEHLKRYLQQLSTQPLNNSSGSQVSELNSTGGNSNSRYSDPDMDSVSVQDQNVGNRRESGRQNSRQSDFVQNSRQSDFGQSSRQSDFGSSVTEEEILMYQSQQLEEKKRSLEKQQRHQLERLMEEQRREKERLEQELIDQEERLRRAQQQLYHVAEGRGHVADHHVAHHVAEGGHVGHHVKQEAPPSLIPPHMQAAMMQDSMTESEVEDSPRGVPFGRVLLRGSNRYHPDNRYSYQEPPMTPDTPTSGHDSDPDTPIKALAAAAAKRRKPVVRVPEKALDPAMKPKYDRISAAVKGYLTRRLLRTEKVRGLIKTIKDTAEFAISFHSEASIKNGIYSMQDLTLQERVIAQLRAALLEVHEIFFEVSTRERMSYIFQSRELERERKYRTTASLKRTQSDSRGKNKKLSVATQRALERKKHAREAEQTMLNLAVEMRRQRQQAGHPRDHVHQSLPTREHRESPTNAASAEQPHRLRTMDIRALRPIQGQSSPMKPTKPSMEKDASRPQTAPSKTRTVTPKEDLPSSRVRRVDHGADTRKPSSRASSTSSKSSASASVPTTRLKSVSNQNNNSRLLSKPQLTTVPVNSATNRRR